MGDMDAMTQCLDMVAFPWITRYGHWRASSETGRGGPPFCFNGWGRPATNHQNFSAWNNLIKTAATFEMNDRG